MADFSRDINIGKTQTQIPVFVNNLAEVTVAVEAVKDASEDELAELKKIRRGTEIIGGQDIGEVT